MSLGAAELTLRALPFADTPVNARLRHPGLYADPFSDDDYWILQYVFKHRRQPPENPHPLLGWVGSFDRETYRHDQSAEIAGRRPVLMYGDSFTVCARSEKCFQNILNADDEFARDHALLNYGVGVTGWGRSTCC